MAEDKLYITISNKATEGEGGAESGEGSEKNKTKTLGKYAEHQFFNFINAQAKKFVNYQVQNIGNMTGDYVAQQSASNALETISGLVNLGTVGMAGAIATGTLAGGAIGAGIALVAQIGNLHYERRSYRIQMAKTNYAIGELRKRSGNDTYTDGSRTGI